jgi:hypothetical protein
VLAIQWHHSHCVGINPLQSAQQTIALALDCKSRIKMENGPQSRILSVITYVVINKLYQSNCNYFSELTFVKE